MNKIFSTSFNIPTETLNTLVDVDNKNVEITINDALKTLNSKKETEGRIRSMNTTAEIPEEFSSFKYINPTVAIFRHDEVEIFDIKRKPYSSLQNQQEFAMFKLNVEFSTGKKTSFIAPSFVRFYSTHTGTFCPIEYIKSRVILIDYTGNSVKVNDSELVDNYTMKDFYNVCLKYDASVTENSKEKYNLFNFYLNGLLANIPLNYN